MISDIEIYKLEIPFRFSFKHSSFDRRASESVVVKLQCKGVSAYGEACPRSYVTNEDYRTCYVFLEKIKNDLKRADLSLEGLRLFRKEHRAIIEGNPAAWCAIEMAFIDLISKLGECKAEDLLDLKMPKRLPVTGVIGITGFLVCFLMTAAYKLLGFQDMKLKISGEAKRDIQALKIIHIFYDKSKVRIDANNLWSNLEEASTYLASLKDYFWAIEEPLVNTKSEDLSLLAEQCKCQVILDEHFISLKTMEESAHLKGLIWNLRVSKNGGILNCLEILEYAKTKGLKLILGSQVGETSLLTKAASFLAEEYQFRAFEIGYSRALLRTDLFSPVLGFLLNHNLKLPKSNSFGFGLSIDLKIFEKYAKKLSYCR